MKLDLLKANHWSPRPELARFYFENNYVNVTASKGHVYYKFVGFDDEIENTDEVISQITYFFSCETNKVHESKF